MIQRTFVLVEAETPAGHGKPVFNEIGDNTRATHARAEAGVVVTPAARSLYQTHDVFRPERLMPRQPFAEQILDLIRQAQ